MRYYYGSWVVRKKTRNRVASLVRYWKFNYKQVRLNLSFGCTNSEDRLKKYSEHRKAGTCRMY